MGTSRSQLHKEILPEDFFMIELIYDASNDIDEIGVFYDRENSKLKLTMPSGDVTEQDLVYIIQAQIDDESLFLPSVTVATSRPEATVIGTDSLSIALGTNSFSRQINKFVYAPGSTDVPAPVLSGPVGGDDIATAQDLLLDVVLSSEDYDYTINLKNIDDNGPVFVDGANITFDPIPEDIAEGTVIGQVTAHDADGDLVSYAITSGNVNDVFTIDEVTGAVSIAKTLDFEAQNTYTLEITTSSSFVNADGSTETAKTEIQTVTITVTDVNEAPDAPSLDTALPHGPVLATGDVVGTFTATDQDAGQTETLIYSLLGDDADLFDIDSATGQVTFIGSDADMKAPGEGYDLTVVATDSGGLTSTVVTSIIQGGVYIQTKAPSDTADNPQHFSDSDTPLLPEALEAHSHQDSVDHDSDPSTDAVYLIGYLNDLSGSIRFATNTADFLIAADGNNDFAIYYTGDHSGDFESESDTPFINLVITADRGDDGNGNAINPLTYNYRINLSNVNDNDPAFEAGASAAFDTIPEDAVSGTVIGQVSALDADGDGVSYQITSGDDDGLFEIDADGQITLAAGQSLNYEEAEQHHLEVTVTSTSDLVKPDGSASQPETGTINVTINVGNVNDAPTAITISRAALIDGTGVAGELGVVDEDSLNPGGDTEGYSYRKTGNGADAADFDINPSNNELFFTGTRKDLGESYEVEIEVTNGIHSHTQTLIIAEGSLFLTGAGRDDDRYSNFKDAQGQGLIPENTDASSSYVYLGKIQSHGEAGGFLSF